MKFFKKIFSSDIQQNEFVDRRKEERYAIAVEFPLIVESHGILLEPITISLNGIGFFSPKDFNSDLIMVNFILEQKELSLVSEVRFKKGAGRVHYGVEFKYRNEAQKKDYYQMILPIILGNSLKEEEDEKVELVDPGKLRRVFRSNIDASLFFYYLEGGSAAVPEYFEFYFETYMLTGNMSEKNIKVFDRKNHELIFITPIPLIKESKAFTDVEDMILLFRWTVLNLSKRMPVDLINYLHAFL